MKKSSIFLGTPRFITTYEINKQNPNWYKKHKNESYTEIIFIQEGCGEFILNDHHTFGNEGDLIIFNPFRNSEGKSSISNPIQGISVCFSSLHINGENKGWVTNSVDTPIIHLQDQKVEISQYLQAILSEYHTKSIGYEDIISSILQAVIIKVSRLSRKTDHPSISSVCLIVKKYIEDNFSQDVTLNELANLVFVSPYHLSHVFKEEVGLPPIQYLIYCRIEEAKRLLRDSDLSVREIGLIIGYENPHYFNLLFKKITGHPPGKYRKILT